MISRVFNCLIIAGKVTNATGAKVSDSGDVLLNHSGDVADQPDDSASEVCIYDVLNDVHIAYNST